MESRAVSSIAVVLFALASAACTDAVESPSNDGTSRQEVVTCGGFGNLPCPKGDECVIADADKNVPDATGTCRPASSPPPTGGDAGPSEGAVCGGFANLPCPAGQTCVLADADKNIPDATGTCR
jgi:hypothetical protein